MDKKLYKSQGDRKLCGVCGGLGEFFGIDASLIRLGWIVFSMLGGSGVLAYIIAALVMPDEPLEHL